MSVRIRSLLPSVLVGLGTCLVAATAPALAQKSPPNVQFISLHNGPGYTIKTVTLKWKVGDDVRQERWTSNITSSKGFCVDLSKVKADTENPIPEGAEVWLVVDIDAGETKSCRKDTKKFYKANNQHLHYKIGGTTFDSNRCRFAGKSVAKKNITSGNSKACG